MLGAVVTLGLAILGVVFGVNLLPAKAVAATKGTLIPWFLTWGMIWITTLVAVVLAVFLAVTGLNESRRSS
jgi:hypothetical protein